ncbi:MAG: alpha/beta hydrolase [Acidocella sp.]|nr:alpha/beta hydrolase [Acidocella sp.]
MPTVILDGINTRYEVAGEGPPILMFSPGGFDATVEKWSQLGIYAKVKPLDHLTKHFQCIMFDRRECGQTGGRVERVTLGHFVKQAKALLDHLGIGRAHLMGGCMGCSPVAAFAVTHPEMVMKMVLYWPVGGVKYRINGQLRFAEHLGFATRYGMQAVVDLVKETGKPFGGDPRGGPWASVIKNDTSFAAAYAALDIDRYKITIMSMQNALLDRDTVPGLVAEDLMLCDIPALIVPGSDASHATSAARYFHECLPKSEYWDVAVDNQTEIATAARLINFLQS